MRKIFALTSAFILSVALVGCGNGSKSTYKHVEQNPDGTSKKIEKTVETTPKSDGTVEVKTEETRKEVR